MKKICTFSFILLQILLFSCSENDIEEIAIDKTKTYSITQEYDPYISSEMQDIINLIDTSTTSIPVEKLIPFLSSQNKNELKKVSLLTTNSASASLEVATGYDNNSVLYTQVETEIDATQAVNFGINSGTYYVTCVAATKVVYSDGSYVTPYVFEDDIMGINPDDLSQIGYTSQEVSAGEIYIFTTYIWGIAYGDTSEYYVIEWIPRHGDTIFNVKKDLLKNLEWSYFLMN